MARFALNGSSFAVADVTEDPEPIHAAVRRFSRKMGVSTRSSTGYWARRWTVTTPPLSSADTATFYGYAKQLGYQSISGDLIDGTPTVEIVGAQKRRAATIAEKYIVEFTFRERLASSTGGTTTDPDPPLSELYLTQIVTDLYEFTAIPGNQDASFRTQTDGIVEIGATSASERIDDDNDVAVIVVAPSV